jgi:hypothetical protein
MKEIFFLPRKSNRSFVDALINLNDLCVQT